MPLTSTVMRRQVRHDAAANRVRRRLTTRPRLRSIGSLTSESQSCASTLAHPRHCDCPHLSGAHSAKRVFHLRVCLRVSRRAALFVRAPEATATGWLLRGWYACGAASQFRGQLFAAAARHIAARASNDLDARGRRDADGLPTNTTSRRHIPPDAAFCHPPVQ